MKIDNPNISYVAGDKRVLSNNHRPSNREYQFYDTSPNITSAICRGSAALNTVHKEDLYPLTHSQDMEFYGISSDFHLLESLKGLPKLDELIAAGGVKSVDLATDFELVMDYSKTKQTYSTSIPLRADATVGEIYQNSYAADTISPGTVLINAKPVTFNQGDTLQDVCDKITLATKLDAYLEDASAAHSTELLYKRLVIKDPDGLQVDIVDIDGCLNSVFRSCVRSIDFAAGQSITNEIFSPSSLSANDLNAAYSGTDLTPQDFVDQFNSIHQYSQAHLCKGLAPDTFYILIRHNCEQYMAQTTELSANYFSITHSPEYNTEYCFDFSNVGSANVKNKNLAGEDQVTEMGALTVKHSSDRKLSSKSIILLTDTYNNQLCRLYFGFGVADKILSLQMHYSHDDIVQEIQRRNFETTEEAMKQQFEAAGLKTNIAELAEEAELKALEMEAKCKERIENEIDRLVHEEEETKKDIAHHQKIHKQLMNIILGIKNRDDDN